MLGGCGSLASPADVTGPTAPADEHVLEDVGPATPPPDDRAEKEQPPPSPAEAYGAYGELVEWLSGGSPPLDAMAAFDAVLLDDDLERVAVELEHVAVELEHVGADDRGRLYALLMQAAPNPDVLYGHLADRLDLSLARAGQRRSEHGAIYAWQAAYALDAALEAYEVSGQERFLRLARDAMLQVLEHRDDRTGREDELRGRVLRSWGTDFGDREGRYTHVVTHAGRIAAPMARYAWIVDAEPSLADGHGEAGERLLTAAAEVLAEFDEELRFAGGADAAYYWRIVDDRVEPLNHQTSAGEALLYLDAATGDPLWAERSAQLARFVSEVLHEAENGTVVWRYAPRFDDPRLSGPEAVWKGQVTIRYLVHAERRGVLDVGVLEDVAASVRTNVLGHEEGLNALIDPEYEPLEETDRYGGMGNLVPYLLLGPYDEALAEEIEELVATRPEIGGWLPHQRNAVVYLHR
jgi:hypothetical protein